MLDGARAVRDPSTSASWSPPFGLDPQHGDLVRGRVGGEQVAAVGAPAGRRRSRTGRPCRRRRRRTATPRSGSGSRRHGGRSRRSCSGRRVVVDVDMADDGRAGGRYRTHRQGRSQGGDGPGQTDEAPASMHPMSSYRTGRRGACRWDRTVAPNHDPAMTARCAARDVRGAAAGSATAAGLHRRSRDVGSAMIWFGGAIVGAFFLAPTAAALGKAGQPFMDHLMRRRGLEKWRAADDAVRVPRCAPSTGADRCSRAPPTSILVGDGPREYGWHVVAGLSTHIASQRSMYDART